MEFCDSSVTGGRIGGANEMKRGYAERVSEQSPSVEKRLREDTVGLIERAAAPKWFKG